MNIIEVAQNAGEISKRQDVFCPSCKARQFSIFDKLYTVAYDKCVDCSTPMELDEKSENIFALL